MGGGGLVRLRLDFGYDGTAYAGWARQPGQVTVEQELLTSLTQVLRAPVRMVVAGRTDAGVHARAQVAHVDVDGAAYVAVAAELLRRLLGSLPADIRMHRVAPAPEGFDARFSALWRRYAYRLRDDASTQDPLERGWVVVHPRPLDVDALNAASGQLLGEHDFAAFCRRREGATTVRTLLGLSWRREDAGRIVATVRADAFCHSMVRALVGALLPAGDGRRPTSWPAEVLAGRVRHSAVTVAPARGLVLEEVRYPPDAELASRARTTRTTRILAATRP